MSVSLKTVHAVVPVIGLLGAAMAYAQQGATYTTAAHFNHAAHFRHNTEGVADLVDGRLVIRNEVQILPYLWVACSTRGTVVRIATSTVDPITGREGVQPGDVLGEYRVAPDGCARDPSRTAVDFDGSVWAGNRRTVGLNPQMGQVIKIGSGLVSHEWKDRDLSGNVLGQLDTSDRLGDIRGWPNGYPSGTCDGRYFDGLIVREGDVAQARDELILLYQPVEPTGVRQVSITRENDLWVGGTDNHELRLLDGRTGEAIPGYEWQLTCPAGASGAYGGFVDRCGGLWSASGGFGADLVRIHDATKWCRTGHPYSYGLGVDLDGYVWTALHQLDKVHRLNPVNHTSSEYGLGPNQHLPKGLAVSPFNNDVWIANSGTSHVTRLPNDGVNQPQVINLLYQGHQGEHPTGVAVDHSGYVWVTNRDSDDVMRINPSTNSVDRRVPLGDGCGPYDYSDMTALNLMWTVAPAGVWTAVHDSGAEDTVWGTVTWNAVEAAPRTSLMVQVRAANIETDLGKARYMTVQNGLPFECAECNDFSAPCYAVVGRYVQLRVQLNAFCHGDTGNGCYDEDPVACTPWPTLQDITITPSATVEDCNGNGIPDECAWEIGPDCNDNDIPDECEVPPICPECPDCNENGIPDECDEDCNDNEIPDDCDISGETSCDIDGNGVPDECGACCNSTDYICRNTLHEDCLGESDTFFVRATCSECGCGFGACCNGSSCAVLYECGCHMQGGFFTQLIDCVGNPCDDVGACCTQGGACSAPTTPGNCTGTYIGRATCAPNPCVTPEPLPCPTTQTFVPDPATGTRDARQPHPPSNSSLAARQGIGSGNTYLGGPEPITVTLGVPCAGHIGCWELCETGPEFIDPAVQPNDFFSIRETSSGVYKILLKRPIAARRWSTITYLGSGSYVEYVSHPADADADGTSSAVDIMKLIDMLNGAIPKPYGKYSCDIDHSNVCGPADILRIIDLLNGADAYFPWLGVRRYPWENRCLGAGLREGGTSAEDALRADTVGTQPADERPVEEFEEFVAGFVKYLATSKPLDSAAEAEFKTIVEALTGFCVQNLSPPDRAKLADKLRDPSLTFASPVAAEVVPDIISRLLN